MTEEAREGSAFETWVLPGALDRPSGRPAVVGRDGVPGGSGISVLAPDPSFASKLVAHLRAARAALLRLPVREIAGELGAVGVRLLRPDDPLRHEALTALAAFTGYSEEMCVRVLDGMATDWTEPRLLELLASDLGRPEALDGFVERVGGGRTMAVGEPCALHIVAGAVPGVSVTSIIRSLLTKTPVLLKPGLGDVVLPVIFGRALQESCALLADALAVLYWPGGDLEYREVETGLLSEVDRLVVYGDDATARDLRDRLRPTVPVTLYHHRVSFGVVGRAGVSHGAVARSAEDCALAISIFDQRGCVSPHLLFVEDDGQGGVELFLEALAERLRQLAIELPSGAVDPVEGSELQQLRASAEMRAVGGQGAIRSGGARAPWTVLVEDSRELFPSCLNRCVRIYPVRALKEIPGRVSGLRAHLQTAGVVGVGNSELAVLAGRLGEVGVRRVAPMRSVPFPPGTWHHDGQGPLRALVNWVDLEDGRADEPDGPTE